MSSCIPKPKLKADFEIENKCVTIVFLLIPNFKPERLKKTSEEYRYVESWKRGSLSYNENVN